MYPRTPLVDPSAYFGRSDRPSLGVAAGIVTLNAVLTVLLTWWFVSRVVAQIDISAATRQEALSNLGGMYFAVFGSVFLGWLLVGAVFHVFMWFAGADRGIGATLAVVGESMLVSIVMMPLIAFGFVLVIDQVPSSPEAAVDFIRRIQGRETGVLLLVGFVRLLWEGGVQAVGLSDVHDVSLGKAALVTIGIGLLAFLVA